MKNLLIAILLLVGVGAATPVTPTFNTLDFSDRDAGLVQEAFWRNTGAGYRNRLY